MDTEEFDILIRIPDPRHVQQGDRHPPKVQSDLDYVPGRPRRGTCKRRFPTRNRIEQRRLSDIRPANKSHLEPVPDRTRSPGALDLLFKAFGNPCEAIPDIPLQIFAKILVREIQRRLNKRKRSHQILSQLPRKIRKRTTKHLLRQPFLRRRFSIDQIGQTFQLNQVKFTVQQRAIRKLPGTGRPVIWLTAQGLDQGIRGRITSMYLIFNSFFTCIAVSRIETKDNTGIDQFPGFRIADITQPRLPDCRKRAT